MKIVSCFSRADEIAPLAEAGADELYCAVADIPSYGFGVLRGGLATAVTRAHRLGKKVSLAVNSMRLTYSRAQMLQFAGRLRQAAEHGVDAFIVASPAVFELFRELKEKVPAPVHLSSVQPCFNSGTARYFIRLGISRLILPSQVAPAEAAGILRECRAAGVETEIFDYRFFGCVYVNGRCNLHDPVFHTFTSGKEGDAMCRCGAGTAGRLEVRPADVAPARAALAPALARRLYTRMTCGGPPRLANAAAFFDFFRGGVDFLKYGTRRDPSGVKVRKVRELRALLDLAEALKASLPAAAARAEFIRRMSAWRGLEGGGR
ncbi:MAG: U32 family peptidase [Elusimicrobiales bacterium]|nr:U32 family peptidase [Elusimicrobiales bacterium]